MILVGLNIAPRRVEYYKIIWINGSISIRAQGNPPPKKKKKDTARERKFEETLMRICIRVAVNQIRLLLLS